ncbi:uncharacterized protein LOC128883019 isoform X2 [Hylaeus volcanicus]|uniref:uncharacterized protein LOC128883019 isoform X2 n=1 Tax=Hylaeus volcanicus TaxID=313075 RepID=UPI0023B7FC55|nr:uncharacterized protein LOC128883019 isoform X2 [Hylaeus volcanicus]
MKRQKLSTSCAPSNNVLFEDLFYITSLDNSKFEKVGRIRGRSSGFDANIVLDVNINIYPLEPKQNLTICITTSVALPSTAKEELTAYDLSDTTPQRLNTLMDEYDYVMYGRIFRLVENPSDQLSTRLLVVF